MPDTLQLSIVTPERSLVQEIVDGVQVPGLSGYLGILPGHSPLFSELSIGELSYTQGDQTHSLAIAGGFVEILGDEVRILADVAEGPGDIDLERAERAGSRAAEIISGSGEDVDFERALKAGQRASSRIEVATRKTRGG